MGGKYFLLVLIIAFRINSCVHSGKCYCLLELATGLRHPTTVIPMPGLDDCLLVGEHRGIVKVFFLHEDNIVHEVVFLDIADRVFTSKEPADERGLLSFAMAPDFPASPYVYVCYTAAAKSVSEDHRTVISRFEANAVDEHYFKADRDSEHVILEISQPGPRYNGGQLLFGPDGYLYIATGDGGNGTDNRFNLKSLLGKVLRIDVEDPAAKSYTIPADNPFVDEGASARPEILAYGFRNPWRCTFFPTSGRTKSRGTASLLCGDTGIEPHRTEEEVYLVQSGKRYGWMDLEHSPCRTVDACAEIEPNIPTSDGLPVFTYAKADGQAIVGGIVYRGQRMPELRGRYLYADFVHGSLHALLPQETPSSWSSKDLCVQLCDYDSTRSRELPRFYILGIGEDSSGEPLVMTTTDLSNESPRGTIYSLRTRTHACEGPTTASADEVECALFSVILVSLCQLVHLSYHRRLL